MKITEQQVDFICSIIEVNTKIGKHAIFSKSRTTDNTDARFIFCVALKLKYNFTARDISELLKRHHASVLNAFYEFHNRYILEIDYRNKVKRIFEAAEIKYDGRKLTDYKK